MSIREDLALYKEGKLTGDALARVEQLLEEHEAVSEFLLERDLGDDARDGELGKYFPEESADAAQAPDAEAERAFEKAVTARIRTAFAKAGLITAGAVLALVILGALILPRLADAFYYDPLERSEEGANALSADLAAFTELFRPDYYRNFATAERLGYGAYEVCVYDLNAAVPTRTVGTLRKNRLLLYDGAILAPLSGRFTASSAADIAPDPEAQYQVTLSAAGLDYAALYSLWTAEGFSADGLWVAVDVPSIAGDTGFFAAGADGALLTPEEAALHFDGLVAYLKSRPQFLLLTSVSADELAGVEAGTLPVRGIIARMSGSELERLAAYGQFDEISAVKLP